MEEMFDLDVQVRQTTLQNEASWFTQTVFCSMCGASCVEDQM